VSARSCDRSSSGAVAISARIWFNARVRSRRALERAKRNTRIASTLPSRGPWAHRARRPRARLEPR
jgi:hypothetical protein